MTDIQLIVTYLREDGRYLGGLHYEQLEKGAKTKFTIPDNGGLEHILSGTIDTIEKTKEGRYSFLLKLDTPAPQRVIDMQWFRKMKECNIGSVEYEKLKIYSDVVLRVGSRFEKAVSKKQSSKKISIRGEVVSEETELLAGIKYAFTIKLDNKLSEDDYKFLKSIDVNGS